MCAIGVKKGLNTPRIFFCAMSSKRWLILGLVVLSLLFVVGCQPGEEVTFETVWEEILSIGKLEFLGFFEGENALTGFMRVLIGVLVFTVLFALTSLTGLPRNIGITLAVIISIISIIFIPGTILAGIGASYGFIVALLMIAIPVGGCLYGFFMIPTTSRALIGLRIVILTIALWILFAVKAHATDLLAGAFP